MTQYFLSEGDRFGNLWKREDSQDFFFSLKSFEWLPCKWVMILPSFKEISTADAQAFISSEKESGPYMDEQLPVRYFLSDNDIVYALDVPGNEYLVLSDHSLQLVEPGTIDCMWGGIGENEIDEHLPHSDGVISLPTFELKILSVKELENNQALITAEDGAGIELSMIEKDYATNKDTYVPGEKGVYQIIGELESVFVPEDCTSGILLEGDEAKEFFIWAEGFEPDFDVDEATVRAGYDDCSSYHQCDDFEQTGRYTFSGIVSSPACLSVSEEIDEPDPEKNCGFNIPLMNQYSKENPRFITAEFPYPQYHKGAIEEGWAVDAVLTLIVSPSVREADYKYGDNRTVSSDEKGYYDYEDDDSEDETDYSDAQCHGDHWGCITADEKEFSRLLSASLEKSELYGQVTADYILDDQVHGKVSMLEYSEPTGSPIVIRDVLAENGKDQIQVVSAYPVVRGCPVSLAISEIHEWSNGLEAWITGELTDGRSITFFDADYALNKGAYRIGDTHTFVIGALAYEAVTTESSGFSFEGEKAVEFLAKIGEEPEYDESGSVKPVNFSTATLCAFFQIGNAPDDAEFISTVSMVEAGKMFGQKFWKFDCIYRGSDEDESVLRIPTYLMKSKENKKLSEAAQIQGLLWVVGYLAR